MSINDDNWSLMNVCLSLRMLDHLNWQVWIKVAFFFSNGFEFQLISDVLEIEF